MGTRLYPLPLSGENEDKTKIWYPLSLAMQIEINFIYKNRYEIPKHVPVVIPIQYYTSFKVYDWVLLNLHFHLYIIRYI